jgi:DNA-binding response OmpR family regulator
MKRVTPIGQTIRELRAEIRVLRAESKELLAKNVSLTQSNETLIRLHEIEEAFDEPIPLMWNLPLTKIKRRLLGILYRTPDIVPRERLCVLMWGVDSGKDPKGIDVQICQLRQRLRPHDIAINTAWAIGYELARESRPKLQALIDQQARVAAAAVRPINGVTLGASHALDA